MAALAERTPKHPWMGNGFGPYLVLALWATFAAAGILAVDLGFRIWVQAWPPAWWLAIAAAAFALVDWAESCQNFTMAMRGDAPARRAFLDSIYWTRALCVVLFAFGAVGGIADAALVGTSAVSLADAWQKSQELIVYFGTVAIGAGLGVGLGVVLNHLSRSPAPRATVIIQTAILSPLVVSALIPIGIFGFYQIWRIAQPAFGGSGDVPAPPAELSRFAGLLVLLQLALIYFVNALTWAGEPMVRARLGSIVPLQLCVTPGQVKRCLDRWCSMLRGHAAATCTMSAVVREALFRDMIGFIPVYSATFTLALWFGFTQLGWSWLEIVWWALPFTTLAADYGEDFCHLRCLRLHRNGQMASIALSVLGAIMTWVKILGFAAAAALTLAIVTAATVRIYVAPDAYGWRGVVALGLSLVAGLILGGLTIGSLVYRALTGTARREAQASADSRTFSFSESTGETR